MSVSVLRILKIFFRFLGLEDTTVIYYYGDLRADRTYKWKMLREGQSALNDGQMLGVAVSALPTCSVVFAITENCVQSFMLESGSVQKKVDLEEYINSHWVYFRFNTMPKVVNLIVGTFVRLQVLWRWQVVK